MVNSEDFAKRLEKILEFYTLSATQFAYEMNFNRSTISHLLSGRNKPSLEFVMNLLKKFPEVNLYWLMDGKGTFPSSKVSESKIVEAKPEKTESPKNKNREPDLFSEISAKNHNEFSPLRNSDDSIERIVIFYKNGSFKSYQN
ncbi:helix-turn-helix domain-containing protein [Aequorivita echinoideorum]|uniref:Helix-turn-helix domain-containing protein n=1 Tax=Aequorivita echinoideorum TaxID=1549647 RepID=A0ABS5S6D2_9FLAO|nr:helix-turn-helix transcriptional regulator [Aequorivita echinoideorum]MBT0608761.1 helix-turn-helix domain-containing protein [Aequorivita echinoideorum]